MKKILKILILIAILILLFNTNTQVYALSGIVEEGQDFIQEGQEGLKDPNGIVKFDTAALQNLSGYLYNILLALGVVVAVIVATILGIQFMIGGAEGQAKVKEMLLPFVVGCVVVFGGFGFWKIAISIGERLEETTTVSTPERIEDDTKKWKDKGIGDALKFIKDHGNDKNSLEDEYNKALAKYPHNIMTGELQEGGEDALTSEELYWYGYAETIKKALNKVQ